MAVSLIYPLEDLTLKGWHSLLSNEKEVLDPKVQADVNGDGTYVYQVYSETEFEVNDVKQAPGFYYIRASKQEALKLADLVDCVKKFSFSELVFLSDNFSTLAIPKENKIEDLALAGDCSQYFENELSFSFKGLEQMRKKVWTKSFDKGIIGFFNRLFSAIANIFKKYGADTLVETSIYWPGDSCNYADRVVKQLNRIKRVFVYRAHLASKKVLSERLNISLEKLNDLNEEGKLKKLYYDVSKQLHPDKNPNNPKALDSLHQISSVWKDFTALEMLNKEFSLEAGDFEYSLQITFGAHQYKRLL